MPVEKISVTIDKELLKKFKKYCEDNDMNHSKPVARAIKEYLKKRGIK